MEKENVIFDNFLVMDTNVGSVIKDKNIEFPFKATLSFELLIKHIKSVAESDDEIKKALAMSILKEFNNAPEMHGQISDLSLIKKYDKLIDNMMMFVFPSAFWDKQTYAACIPYSDEIIYGSPKFRELIKMNNGVIEGELNIDMASYNLGKTIISFIGVLSKFYGVHLNLDFPLVYKILDPVTKLDRYFKLNNAAEFVDIIPKGKLKKLSKKDLESIKMNIYNVQYVADLLEPDNFVYTGFIVMNVINITDTEILSAIRKDLIEKDTITSFAGFMKLQHKLKSLLKCPDLLLGIADYPGQRTTIAMRTKGR
ncbi:MAG: hypothetical protein IPL53_15835 [Ignavibacteria bacterium]|nr:hypothetical protein [Ignavibacteria bacterium]